MAKRDFIICGIAGWCLEVLWTGLISFINNDPSMSSTTSILMFPIYALAAFIKPISKHLEGTPLIVRGLIYTMGIFIVEYAAGYILKSLNMCPWDYGHARYNINELVRLDYAPVWFIAGLFFEKLLNTIDRRAHTSKQQI